MKKLSLFFIFLFLIPFTSAFYAGEDIVLKHLDKCNHINVVVSADQDIDKGEYFLKDCTRIDKNEWGCNCSDNYDLILQTNIRTRNNYFVNIFYEYAIQGQGGDDNSTIGVSGDDLILDEVSYEKSILTLKITSSGTKTITIDVGSLGEPNKFYVNGVPKIKGIDWTYDNGIITITLEFSTKILELDYNTPPSGGNPGGGGPSGGNKPLVVPIVNEEVKTSKLECAPGYTLSERQECTKIETEQKIEAQEPVVENVQSNPVTGFSVTNFVKDNKIGTIVTLVIVALLLILFFYLKLRKKE